MRKALVMLGLLCLASCQTRQTSTGEEERAKSDALARQQIEESKKETEEQAARFKWRYEADKGAAQNANKRAIIYSLNTVDLAAPYDGAQRGKLLIRHHTDAESDIIFSIERGQLVGDAVSIRFDGGKAFKLVLEPSDGNSNVIFLSYPKLIAKLRTASTMALEATLSGNGAKVFEFDVSGLDMKKLN